MIELLLLGVWAVVPALATCPSHPDPWTSNNGSCYWKSPFADSWENARLACQDMAPGGDLTSVADLLENAFLVEVMGAAYTWIGLTDQQQHGQWMWSDGTTVQFLYWAPMQPDNLLLKQHCAQVYDPESAQWDDEDCTVEKNFICKAPAS